MTTIDYNSAKSSWVWVARKMKSFKLKWFKNKLDENNIPNRYSGYSMQSRVLEVPLEYYEQSFNVMNQGIGEILIGIGDSQITFDDLPDDHPFFEDEIMKQTEFAFDAPAHTSYPPDKDEHSTELLYNLPMDKSHVRFDNFSVEMGTLIEADVLLHKVEHFATGEKSKSIKSFGFKTVVPNKEDFWYLIVEFQAGTFYRYTISYAQLIAFVRVAIEFYETGASSLGSYFHHQIRVPADNGQIPCEKYTSSNTSPLSMPTNRWVAVYPKNSK